MSPLFKYTIRNLWGRPFTTFLLVASMVIVGGAMVMIGAIRHGMQTLFESGARDRVVVSSSADVPEMYSDLAPETIQRVSVVPGVVRMSPEIIDFLRTRAPGGAVQHVRLRGLDLAGLTYYSPKLVAGRLPQNGAREFMVGATEARGHPELAIGGKISAITHEFTCVGVFTAGELYDSELWTTRDALIRDRGTPDPWLNVIFIQTASPAAAGELADRIRALHGINATATVERTYYSALLRREFGDLTTGLAVVLLLLVAGAVLAATSVLAVLFRRRVGDMSVLRAIGYKTGRISALVLLEIELVTVTGALLGGGAVLIALGNFDAHAGFGATAINIHATVPAMTFGVILGVMAAIGAFSSLLPILRLARLDVRDGLRS